MGGKSCKWLRDLIGVGRGAAWPGGGCWPCDKGGALAVPPILGRNGIDVGSGGAWRSGTIGCG